MNDQLYELTAFEKHFLHLNKLGDLLVMGTTFIEAKSNNILIDYDIVKKSLTILQARHPFLRAFLVKKEHKVFLQVENSVKELSKIELDWLDFSKERISREFLVKECEKFNSKLFDFDKENNLLWRFQVISYEENSIKKYIFNLVIGFFLTDGFNISYLLIELLNIINSLITYQTCDEMKIQLEPIESLHYFCEKCSLVKPKHLEDAQKASLLKRKFLLDENLHKINESGFKLDLFKINQEKTKSIQTISKLKKVRLNGYFYAIGFYALRDLYLENGIEFPEEFIINIAASLRIRYKPNLDFSNMRPHVSALEIYTDKNSFGEFKNIWSDAKYISDLIQNNVGLESGLLFSYTHGIDFDENNKIFNQFNNEKELLNHLSQSVSCDFAFSNLGSYVNDRATLVQGPLDITEFYCSDSTQTNPAICMSIIHHILYWKGEMMLQFGINKSKIDTNNIDKYIQNFKKWIDISLNLD